MKIETAANKFYKSINGRIEFETVEKHLKKQGYEVLFFNTPVGDAELARYAQTEKAKTSKAFTYVGTAKIIFINDLLSVEDKLYLLLHEVGHIMLKHLDFERLSAHNRILLDVDADAFVYFLLHRKRNSYLPAVIFAFIAIITVIVALRLPAKETFSDGSKYTAREISEYVVITPAGSHYHRESCGTIFGHTMARIEQSEAEKLFTPCRMCNP